MKKWTAIVLALITVLSLFVGCSKAPATPPINGDLAAPPANNSGMDANEASSLNRYRQILAILDNYAAGKALQYTDDYGNMATLYDDDGVGAYLGLYYDELAGMEAIDYLLEPGVLESMGQEPVSCDRQTLMARFTVIEDVALYERREQIEEEIGAIYFNTYIEYNKDGNISFKPITLRYIDPILNAYNSTYGIYYYDENGTLIRIDDTHFDETGKILYIDYKDNRNEDRRWTFTYTTDADGNITQIEWTNGFDYRRVMTVNYGNNGKVTSRELCYYYINNEDEWLNQCDRMDYTYDANGVLTQAVYTTQELYDVRDVGNIPVIEKKDTFNYTFDDQNRILTVKVLYGDEYYTDEYLQCGNEIIGPEPQKASKDHQNVEYAYGTYAFYEP